MPVRIGRGPGRPGDLVDLLLACHGRIRSFLALARGAAQAEDRPAPEIVEACAAVEAYFGQALPLHVLDEEQSVLPRLQGQGVDAALETMRREHLGHEAKLSELLAACAALRDQPSDAVCRARLALASVALETDFDRHLAMEEELLFPALARLPASVQSDILAELRARRRR